jgi:hypothetical protein
MDSVTDSGHGIGADSAEKPAKRLRYRYVGDNSSCAYGRVVKEAIGAQASEVEDLVRHYDIARLILEL